MWFICFHFVYIWSTILNCGCVEQVEQEEWSLALEVIRLVLRSANFVNVLEMISFLSNLNEILLINQTN